MKELIYNITQTTAGRTITLTGLTEELTRDNILGIINKTAGDVLYTPLDAANISSVSYSSGTLTITLASSVTEIAANDELFVKCYTDNDGYALQGSNSAKTNTQLSSEIADVATLIGYAIQEIDGV